MDLVVLAERDITPILSYNGLKPSKLYTDIDLFKKESTYMTNTVVLIIFTGVCYFNMAKIYKLMEILNESVESGRGIIEKFFVLSDVRIKIPEYYMYDEYNFKDMYLMKNKSIRGKHINIFKDLDLDKCEHMEIINNKSELNDTLDILSNIRLNPEYAKIKELSN